VEEVKENKGCLANLGTFLTLFLGSCLVGFISFHIMFQILAEGTSSGFGDLALIFGAFGITVFAFLVSSIFFVNVKSNSKRKSDWPIWILAIFILICIIIYLFCLGLVASDY
jgi:amino acid permease